jgi:REP element-mobilizing transposase RayT
MARIARADLVDPAKVAVYHCVNRCVRGGYLCGIDPGSGRNFEHRKGWIERRIAWLAGWFGIDVLGFSILSNHFHIILRSRPDIVAGWSDTEIARRWLMLCPELKDKEGRPLAPTEQQLEALSRDAERIAELSSRLSDISWIMGLIAGPLARKANLEEQESGRFWQGRFKCVRLCDEAALLACLAYIDLNLVRAGIATTPEELNHTSLRRRLDANRSGNDPAPWLAPLQLDDSSVGPLPSAGRSRASDKGCLSMSLPEYLILVDWTGRHIVKRGSASIPVNIAPVLERTGIPACHWLHLVQNFGRLFHRIAGAPHAVRQVRPRRNPAARFRPGRCELLGVA